MSQEGFMTLKSILESAIERERMSARMYDRFLNVVKDPEAVEWVKKMRTEEVRHAKQLKKVLETGNTDLLGQKKVSATPPSGSVKPEPKDLTENSKAIDIIKFAIYHEEKAIDYYSRYIDAFKGTAVGDLFEELKKEEEGHRQKLLKLVPRYS